MSSTNLRVEGLQPTVFLRSAGDDLARPGVAALEQQAELQLSSRAAFNALTVRASAQGNTVTTVLEPVPEGKSTRPIYVPELRRDGTLELELRDGDQSLLTHATPWRKPKRWTVHVVQLSHHDAGYTDLKSSVLELHDGFLSEVLDLAEETRDFPEAAQFRMTIEQTWSIHHFLQTASPAKRDRMIELMQSGHIELTALFGNMITNMCGHESLSRTLYHAAAIGRQHGIPILSAQHNDIPGFAWGLATALAEAEIQLFVAGIPYFWSWTVPPYNSIWDQAAVMPGEAPGAFWWEAPGGKRVLFWCNKIGCNGDRYGSFKPLAECLQRWTDEGYPFDAVRWPVCGGFGDNSPYLGSFAAGVKEWNASWAYPRLISSTNARFYADFSREDIGSLPVFRGELPEPDWPLGAMSTSRATAAGRNCHATLPSAERLATLAAQVAGHDYPARQIARAYEDVLWFDEHTWGSHMPCGPAVEAAKLEKAVHAHRAEALAHDVLNKAMARIADSIEKDEEGIYLVVFNSLPFTRTSVIVTPARGLDNCGSGYNLVEDAESGDPLYFIVRLETREHLAPSEELKSGDFTLLDVATDAVVPFQLDTIQAEDETLPYAAERLGVGSGEKRLGGGEDAHPFRQDLRFIATDIPACGYRTYRFAQKKDAPAPASSLQASAHAIENRFYRIEMDPVTGSVTSILDKESDRELVDASARHGFGDVVVRDPQMTMFERLDDVRVGVEHQGDVSLRLVCRGRIHGHPGVTRSFTLHHDQKRIEVAIRVLKDATSLLDAHAAFPFKLDKPAFRYEGALSILTPFTDFFPGAYSDNLPLQNWVKVSDDDYSILWSSLDSPSACFGDLWPGYVSPAHRSVIGDALHNKPLTAEDLQRAWIYSNLFSNNYGTNFAVTQSGDFLFRYIFTTQSGDVDDAAAVRFGWDAVTPLEAILTQANSGSLPPVNSFLEIEDPNLVLLAWKKAEHGDGWILRLWNTADTPGTSTIRMPGLGLTEVRPVNLVEDPLPGTVELNNDAFTVDIPPGSVQTFRCQAHQGSP